MAAAHLDLPAGRGAPPVLLQLLLDQPHAEAQSQEHGPVPRGPAAKPSPQAGGLKLGRQAPQRGAVVAVPRGQESPRLKAVDPELSCDSAARFEETQVKERAAQLESAANYVFHGHNLTGKVT